MIELEGVKKSFGKKAALDGFTLRVEQGECCGLVGPNGAGKTTLIKILATLLPQDDGVARIAGHEMARDSRQVRSVVGYLPDVAGLYQDMRVAELLDFYADAFRLKGARRGAAIERAIEQSGLEGRRDAFVEELSLGLKQRLLLAKTLLHAPKVLLLDEPATGLDPLARAELRNQLNHLRKQGVTILISSHILSDLEDICTRVALIADGKNATDEAGRAVIPIAEPARTSVVCEIEVAGTVEAEKLMAGIAGARLLAAAGNQLRVEVSGGAPEASAVLRELLARGAVVARFDTRGPGLEEKYRKIFEYRKN